jgi:selenocysteine-specific elongation factor
MLAPTTIGRRSRARCASASSFTKVEMPCVVGSDKDASLEDQILQRVARRGTSGLSLRMLRTETGLTGEALSRITEPLTMDERMVLIAGEIWLTREGIENATEKILSRVKAQAKARDLKRSELKSQIDLSAETFDFVLHRLSREKRLELRGEVVFSVGKGQPITSPDSKLLPAIASAYEASGLTAPSAVDVALRLKVKDSEMRKLMTLLLREKTLVRMGTDELYIHRIALEGLRAKIRELHGEVLDVPRFKQITGLSRKYAIPLLEYLDRERVTRKDGDLRIVL